MWIKIEDFKPDERTENIMKSVLCFGRRYENTYIAQYVNGRFKFPEGSQAENDTITHWMPLPQKPYIMNVDNVKLNIPQLRTVLNNQINDYIDVLETEIRIVGLRDKIHKRIKTLSEVLVILNEHNDN